MNIGDVLNRLEGTRTAGHGQWMARCPAHDDKTPSLSIGLGNDDCIVLNCHAGCRFETILETIGITAADLFAEKPSTNGQAARVAEYDYRDEAGTLLFQVVRYVPKDFRQRRPDGQGGWKWNLGDVRRVPFRLPELLAATGRVFIVEGEKDVNTIVTAGGIATCNAGGAGKWRPEFAAYFVGADEVVVVADLDEPGRKHARQVAESLRTEGIEVRIVEPKAGKDAADHLGAGHTLDDFIPAPMGDLGRRHARATDDRDREDDPVAVAVDGYRLTDTGNASRLIDLADGNLRYVHAWGRWIIYSDGRWVVDNNDALVTELAKQVARRLFNMLAETDDEKQRKQLFGWAVRSESSGSILSTIRLARGVPSVLTEHEDLDADPYLLNVANGTINLRTGQLQAHDPADLMTMQINVAYDDTATCPLWWKCLDRWQPDPLIRGYLQLEAGAAATGRHTETLSIHYGTGGNGKSKFWGAIQHVLGPYATVPNKSLLVASKHEQHETVKADLFRKRLGVASETKAADSLDEEQVKAITGGDRMRARRMREDSWFFDPSHTLIIFTNYRPKIRGRDEAIWRRVRLIPWDVTIPADEVDETLNEKLQTEEAGILNWIVTGARAFITEGFDPPEAIQTATTAYRAEEDVVGRFITEVLQFGPLEHAFTADLTNELDQWCREHGAEITMNDLAAVLKAKDCESKRRVIGGRRGTVWARVSLINLPEDTTFDLGEQ